MENIAHINYELLAAEIAKKIAAQPEVRIWTAVQCAEYLGITERHFMNWLSKQLRFPSPIILPSRTGGSGGAKRWYATDIEKWVALHKRAG